MSKPVILLVDDDKQLLDSLTSQLRASSFGKQISIETAQALDEAMETLVILKHEGENVALIISDWLFPHNERSNDFLVKVSQRFPEIPLVLLSGYADQQAVDEAFKMAKLRAYFRKPWEEEDLMNGLRDILVAENSFAS